MKVPVILQLVRLGYTFLPREKWDKQRDQHPADQGLQRLGILGLRARFLRHRQQKMQVLLNKMPSTLEPGVGNGYNVLQKVHVMLTNADNSVNKANTHSESKK